MHISYISAIHNPIFAVLKIGFFTKILLYITRFCKSLI